MNCRGVLRAWALAALCSGLQAQDSSTVGMPARLRDLVLPGTELEVVNGDSRAPVALRIVAARPHGDGFRYELEYWGLDPGAHDLRPYLRRKDGTSTADLPAIAVQVNSVLAEPGLVAPHDPAPNVVPGFGGYRTWMVAGGVAWAVGLIALLAAGRKRHGVLRAAPQRPRTLAEHLRPLVERAMRGELSREERSQLELSLVAYWRRRLALDERRPTEMLSELRRHAEAGPLLQSLEDWLHRPEPARDVDLQRLLAPYRDLPAEVLETAELESATGGAR
ncbi:MAG: hypothetical protein IT454_04605 [Planctomycetes bacterium]|nr:hypothetical protein [Planctomycetota bacterium]